jgi:glutathione S-transferase
MKGINMLLYSHTRSPWCIKLEWGLAEMGVSVRVPTTVLGLDDGASPTAMAEFKEACGKHATLPALKIDSWVLCESSAIFYYLADELDYSGSFYPRDFRGRATVQEWDRIGDILLGAGVLSPWLRNTTFLSGKEPDEAALAKARETFAKLDERISERLSQMPFLGGSHFSYADVCMAHLLTQLKSVGGPQVSTPESKKWFEHCTGRASYVALCQRNAGNIAG